MIEKVTEKHLITSVVLILITQIFLSILIVRKLNNIDDTISHLDRNNVASSVSQTGKFDVSVDDDPWKGSADASIVLVEFGDFECPACLAAVTVVDELLEEYEDELLFVYRDFPLEELHPHALAAAEAANCAGEQDSYWDMYYLLFANQSVFRADLFDDIAYGMVNDLEQFEECMEEHRYLGEIRYDVEEAQRYEVTSVPTFFVNGEKVVGANPEALRSVIERILAEEASKSS